MTKWINSLVQHNYCSSHSFIEHLNKHRKLFCAKKRSVLSNNPNSKKFTACVKHKEKLYGEKRERKGHFRQVYGVTSTDKWISLLKLHCSHACFISGCLSPFFFSDVGSLASAHLTFLNDEKTWLRNIWFREGGGKVIVQINVKLAFLTETGSCHT